MGEFSEKLMMYQKMKGDKMILQPEIILNLAQFELKLFEKTPMGNFAFMTSHLSRANSPHGLLTLAIDENLNGVSVAIATQDWGRFLLYGDKDALRDARILCFKRENHEKRRNSKARFGSSDHKEE
jgi:hypothetical protein